MSNVTSGFRILNQAIETVGFFFADFLNLLVTYAVVKTDPTIKQNEGSL